MIAVLCFNNGKWDVRFPEKHIVCSLFRASRYELAAHDKPTVSQCYFFTNLRMQVPAGCNQRRRDELCANIALAKTRQIREPPQMDCYVVSNELLDLKHFLSLWPTSFSAPVPDRTRSPVNARPAPVRFAHPCRHDVRPFPSGLLLGCNEPIRDERNLTWPALQHQSPTNPRPRTSSPRMSPTKATRPSGREF